MKQLLSFLRKCAFLIGVLLFSCQRQLDPVLEAEVDGESETKTDPRQAARQAPPTTNEPNQTENNSEATSNTFDVGNGSDGDYTVSAAGDSLNDFFLLRTDTSVGANSISVAGDLTKLAADDILMVWQTVTDIIDPVISETNDQKLDMDPGHYEIVKVQAVDAASGNVSLTTALKKSYVTVGSQLVRIPQFKNLTVNAEVFLRARPWNGSVGGIIALFIQDTLTNAGGISASRTGFRGGKTGNNSDGNNCNDLIQTIDEAGGKGESFANDAWNIDGFFGRGSLYNAGGGGNCHNSGGGGGGHGGRGGSGGASTENDEVGGIGGSGLQYFMGEKLGMGGGGGAGHQNESGSPDGGVGGGVVFIHANKIVDSKGFYSQGLDIQGDATNAVTGAADGSSGGGAGGSVYVRSLTKFNCGTANARGGTGGAAMDNHGSGGGGAGGRIFLDSNANCRAIIRGGEAGISGRPGSAGEEGNLNICGDFIVQVGEQCDDGNFNSGDGCSSVCTFE